MLPSRRGRLLALLVLIAVALFDFPVLAIVDHLGARLGPLTLPAFLFLAWGLTIAAMAVLMRKGREP